MHRADQCYRLVAAKTNGEAEGKPSEINDAGKPSAPTEADPGSVAPAAETPASKKGASNGGSSKKKAAVPEHKSKKLNKKKSRPMTNLDGEYAFLTRSTHPI